MLERCKDDLGTVKITNRLSSAFLIHKQVLVEKRENVLGGRREVHVGVADDILVKFQQVT